MFNFFRTKTVDQALSSFHVAIAKLREVLDHHSIEISKTNEKIADHMASIGEHKSEIEQSNVEHTRAFNLLKKLEDFLA